MNDTSIQKHDLVEKSDPVNPWLADAIRELRSKYSDDYLRKRYISYLNDYPDKDWAAFLEEMALLNITSRDSFLLTKRKEFGLPQRLTDVLNTLEVDIVADLMQFTIEELIEMLEQSGEKVDPVIQFLAGHGYKLYSYPTYTYKMPLDSIENERKQQIGVIKDALSNANSIMDHGEELLSERVEKALDIYKTTEHMARSVDVDLNVQLKLEYDYVCFLDQHIQKFPELAKEAPGVAQRALYFSELIHGEKAGNTAVVHRLSGAILTKLERHYEASGHYAAAAGIMKERANPDDIRVGKDFRSAAVCQWRIPDYQKALELFFQAVEVFKKHPEQAREQEETYLLIADCYHSLQDNKNEEKYRLMAAAIRTTDTI